MHPHWECLAAEPNFGIKWLIELLHTQVHEGFSLLTYAYCAHFGDWEIEARGVKWLARCYAA